MNESTLGLPLPTILGRRLQDARKARGITQQEAADHLRVARTTVVAIEKGERRVQPVELVAFASLYGREVGELVRPGGSSESFVVQLRAASSVPNIDEQQLDQARVEFQRLCEDYVELERLQAAPMVRRYPAPYDISRLRPEAAAEDIAVAERLRLGLGDGPLLHLREVLESDVGLRIFILPLPRRVAEMFAYTESLGGCFALNQDEPEERRRMSLAHGYAHFLTNRYLPEICTVTVQRVSGHERFAGAFANAFLMPASGLTRRFHDLLRQREGGGTPADILTLAYHYAVSAEAMTRRLEDLRLVKQGTWEFLKQAGLRVREAQRMLGLPPREARENLLPVRYQYLAVEALAHERISEGQFARFLRTSRVQARLIAERLAMLTPEGEPADLTNPIPGED